MEFNSIIWLEGSKKSKIDKSVIENLNLLNVYKRLIQNEDILYSLCMDKETIEYRQDIIEDFLKNDRLIDELCESLQTFYELKPLYVKEHYSASKLYRIIDILIVIERSVQALEELKQILSYYEIKSKGLVKLKEGVLSQTKSASFKNMKKDLKAIKYVFSGIKSAELSVNMSPGMRPIFAQVTKVNDHKHRYPKAFRHVSDVLSNGPKFLGQHLSSYIPVFRVGKLNYNLIEEIEYALDEHKEMLTSFIDTYRRVDIEPFVNLLDEIEFYKASVELFQTVTQQGLPLSKPEISVAEHVHIEAKGFYNLNLAMLEDTEEAVILNDFLMNEDRKGFVITGANRGGKTTFTQAVGQIQLLSQLGLLVPAKYARVTMVDTIITHFPVGEKDTYETGKFGKECELFVQGFQKASQHSLYLLNESFSGTSHLESLNIAVQGCMALVKQKIPFLFNTHLHELYEELLKNVDQADQKAIISLVTKMEGEDSSYELVEHLPFGLSYARKIALKYGVTYDQLMGGGKVETRN